MNKINAEKKSKNALTTVDSTLVNISVEKNAKLNAVFSESRQMVDSFTMHGLPNIFRSKHWLPKLIWLVLTITGATLTIILIRKSIVEFYEYSVTTEVRLVENLDELIDFPSVLICNKNQLSTYGSLATWSHIFKSFNKSIKILETNYDENKQVNLKINF
jgi:hypothetical protein